LGDDGTQSGPPISGLLQFDGEVAHLLVGLVWIHPGED
jgi:hypothetical protein